MLRAWEVVKGCIKFVGGFIWEMTDAIIVLFITEHNQEKICRVMACLKMSLLTRRPFLYKLFSATCSTIVI